MIIGSNANETWLSLLETLIKQGQDVVPRSLPCIEIVGLQTCTPMSKPILSIAPRNLGYKFMCAEAWWILTGHDDVASIQPFSRMISTFSDNGLTFYGAYGPKILNQIDYVVDKIASDIYTRQAIINIWRENPGPTKDYPCTLSVQFMVRNGQLHCIDTMRSSDAWLGWPYDTFNFSMLSSFIILKLREHYNINLELGNLIMNIGSSHLYSNNVPAVYKCIMQRSVAFNYEPLNPLTEWLYADELPNSLINIATQNMNMVRSIWCKNLALNILYKKGE
jgi:thymidylate synthase